MLKRFILQMFGEGEGEASSTDASNSGDNIPSSIPERARKLYADTVGKSKSTAQKTEETTEAKTETTKIPYSELIKSADYKDEHKAYMESTINDRFKKYKGIETENKQMHEALATVAQKYGIEEGDNFLARLSQAIADDDSYYENYAVEHDMLPSEARKLVSLERKAKAFEAQQEAMRVEEENRERIRVLQTNAERTKMRFPSFDLETEMQNPAFLNICASTNGDTTSAFIAVHHNEIINGAVSNAVQEAKIATANSIASGMNRPVESGLFNQSVAQATVDFSHMSLAQLREYAETQRRRR